MEMQMADQWSNLFLLANTAMSVSEKEKASEYSTSSSSSHLTNDPNWFTAPIKKTKNTEAIGEKAVIVAEKRLTKTDVTRNNNRLSLTGKTPSKVLLHRFLRKDERRRVTEKMGLEVIVVDGHGREYGLVLKLWKMGKSDVYNLISKWNCVASDNGLEENDAVRVYAFRRGDDPCFAIVKI